MGWKGSDRAKEYSKNWRDTHKEHRREYRKARGNRLQRERERIKMQDKAYREERNAWLRRWRRANPEKACEIARRHRFKVQYGITRETYNLMCARQDSRCAVCLKKQDKSKKFMTVDHDHRTGKVRALVCGQCNRGLSHFRDESVIAKRAYEYLRTYEANKLAFAGEC